MPSLIELSEATTGSMLKPVMNLMSSMAKTLVGSTMAMVSEAPTRLSGRIYFEIGEIDRRHAVLAREEIGHVFVGQQAQLHQGRAQATVGLLLDLGSLCQLLGGDHLLLYEKVAQPLRHTFDLLSIDRDSLGPGAKALLRGGEQAHSRVDTNCQRRREIAKVTSVLVLRENAHTAQCIRGKCMILGQSCVAGPAPSAAGHVPSYTPG